MNIPKYMLSVCHITVHQVSVSFYFQKLNEKFLKMVFIRVFSSRFAGKLLYLSPFGITDRMPSLYEMKIYLSQNFW